MTSRCAPTLSDSRRPLNRHWQAGRAQVLFVMHPSPPLPPGTCQPSVFPAAPPDTVSEHISDDPSQDWMACGGSLAGRAWSGCVRHCITACRSAAARRTC